ncbi:uncharacterized protein LOC110685261 [Chenopodium quinoa]|uniref:uncharacterized protein LOC110685261 n=1 Tax=Chenopodium quinoa TaxID=63459 RepID=UPI000B76F910|nr:uncharacterized protein LOC110685261 [Chenopodium quinoa]
MQNRLKTRIMLNDWGVCQERSCLLCGNADEDKKHLFFDCDYSRKFIASISAWLDVPEALFDIDTSWKRWGEVIQDPIKKKVCYAALAAIVYQIWFARNKAFWLKVIIHPRVVCKMIRAEIVQRSRQLINCNWKRRHCQWLYNLQVYVYN